MMSLMKLLQQVATMFLRQNPKVPDEEHKALAEAERRHRQRLQAQAEATKRALATADQVFQVVAKRRGSG